MYQELPSGRPASGYHRLAAWEHNGRDDSDWYEVVYDDQADNLRLELIGTTRYAFPPPAGPKYEAANGEILVKAQNCLLKLVLPTMVREEEIRLTETHKWETGTRVILSVPVKSMVKGSIPCTKCEGKGYWQNPRKETDRRSCFGCNGAGFKDGEKLKGSNGKPVWIRLAAGLKGEILDSRVFGTFYANGYKQVGPRDLRVLVRFDDGKVYWVGGDKLSLDSPKKMEADLIREFWTTNRCKDFYTPFRTARY